MLVPEILMPDISLSGPAILRSVGRPIGELSQEGEDTRRYKRTKEREALVEYTR